MHHQPSTSSSLPPSTCILPSYTHTPSPLIRRQTKTKNTLLPLVPSLSLTPPLMGNNPSSCIPLPPSPGSSSSSSTSTTCKVIHADGRVTRLPRPVRASQLMLDHPGKFVCDACRLAVGCRVPGVAADELLQPRRAYFLLPMDMLYSVLTDDEMAALDAASRGAFAAASSAWKRIVTGTTTTRRRGGNRQSNGAGSGSDGGRVFPVVSLLQLQGDHDAPSGHVTAGSKSTGAGAIGLRRHRSWKPVLDTIDEAP